MLKALFPIIGLAFAFSANAHDVHHHHHSHSHGKMAQLQKGYSGPMPGDLALSRNMCDDVCDMTLTSNNDSLMACHDLCAAMDDCMANHSQNTADLRDCTSNANREYALRLKGHSVRAAAANAEGESAVVTDADNFTGSFEEDNQKGFRDAL